MDGGTVERSKRRKRWEVVALARLGEGGARSLRGCPTCVSAAEAVFQVRKRTDAKPLRPNRVAQSQKDRHSLEVHHIYGTFPFADERKRHLEQETT